MANFQWNESDINWFIENFKDETNEIQSRMVQQKYKRGQKINVKAQDCKNLMRLVVINKHARVTKGHVNSTGYRIKMISQEYPYHQEIFDKNFFTYSPFEKSDLSFIIESYPKTLKWIVYLESEWAEALLLERMYVSAFYAHNLFGGDLDRVFEEFGASIKVSRGQNNGFSRKYGFIQRDSFCNKINFFACQYKLCKTATTELLDLKTKLGMSSLFADHNSLFTSMFVNAHILDFLERVELKKQVQKRKSRTRSNILKELMESVENPEALTQNKRGFDFNDEINNLRKDVIFWFALRDRQIGSDVSGTYKECMEAFFNVQHSLRKGLLSSTLTP